LLAVRVLEALKILEDATLDSKKRDIDTPEVREALDLLDPLCKPIKSSAATTSTAVHRFFASIMARTIAQSLLLAVATIQGAPRGREKGYILSIPGG